jgi:2-methylfumaryl-CoA isomerase
VSGLPLAGLRVIEVSAFVAAPLGGMTLARLGADVIRIDPIGGNFDTTRWPITKDGVSLYWTGLNKGKRSINLALNKPEGRAIAEALITAPGPDGGILLTNLSTSGWMSYASLTKKRADLIMMVLTGNYDGSTAVDYTINCAGGFPSATGKGDEPVNSVIPAWDIASGLYLATGLLAAERVRTRTGKGQEIKVALSDVMFATIGDLGYIADVQINGAVRPADGNYLYGAFGKDFVTKDGRRVMIVGITGKQFQVLGTATGLTEAFAALGPKLGVNMNDEGGRYHAREAIAAVLAPWCASRTLAEIKQVLDGSGVLWGPYQDFGQMVAEDPRCSTANPLFKEIDQPGVGRYLVPSSPLQFGDERSFKPAPRQGEHTDQVLSDVLGMSSGEIAKLHDAKVVA